MPTPLTTKNKNLIFLLEKMSALALDVNDLEICRRLKILVDSTTLDMNDTQREELMRANRITQEAKLEEHIMPFYRHYQYMLKRQDRLKQKAHTA